MDAIFDTPLARELAEHLYERLKLSTRGELSFEDILNVFDEKPEYGLRRVSGGAIHLVRAREDVIQLNDDKGRPFLKLISIEKSN